jgi:hypothetical protein
MHACPDHSMLRRSGLPTSAPPASTPAPSNTDTVVPAAAAAAAAVEEEQEASAAAAAEGEAAGELLGAAEEAEVEPEPIAPEDEGSAAPPAYYGEVEEDREADGESAVAAEADAISAAGGDD